MPAITENDLRAQITSFEINPRATKYLARIYFRRTAERVLEKSQDKAVVVAATAALKGVDWLHPRVVWAAEREGACGGQSSSFSGEERKEMKNPNPAPPALEHLGAESEPWVAESIRLLDSDIKKVHSDHSLRLSGRLARTSRETVKCAAATLTRVWPEAAEEFRTLVRSIVYVEAQGFGSATIPKAFGAVYTSADYVDSVPAAFEMLLHESGHHALYLRNFFTRFVVNGSLVAAHPLRSDPRPIAGVVHSAQALARMATGLTRWRMEPGAPAEVGRRADAALVGLTESLDVLDAEAKWTDAGEKYFAELRACEASLKGGR